jgi:putative ABC transport system permease protein
MPAGRVRTNTLRSALTTLGIMIGVASVIVLVAVGAGARSEVERRIASLGTNLLQINPGSSRVRGRWAGAGTNLPFSERDLAVIRDQVPGVVAASGTVQRAGPVIYGNVNWLTNITVVHLDYLTVRDWELAAGRFFSENEMRTGAKVAAVGVTAAKQLFGDQDGTDAVVRIVNVPFRVVGLLEAKGQTTSGRDQDDLVLIPMTTARKTIMRRNKLL